MVDERSVRHAASQFRSALEARATDLRLLGLARFPTVACGDASRLLAQYFRDSGHGEWSIVSARSQDTAASHAWLVHADWLVDITADQFPEVTDPVIVARASDWHDAWPMRSTSDCRVGIVYYASDSGATEDYALLRRTADELLGSSASAPPNRP